MYILLRIGHVVLAVLTLCSYAYLCTRYIQAMGDIQPIGACLLTLIAILFGLSIIKHMRKDYIALHMELQTTKAIEDIEFHVQHRVNDSINLKEGDTW